MSRIEVDKIQQQCGTTLTVGGGACKTAVVDATTVTLGRCGGTVSLASGATQSGFGRTGTVDWQTGSIKTGTVTAVNGEGYFVNTTAGAVTVNLPAGVAGSIVAVADYTRTWETNNCVVTPNGSEKIGGIAAAAYLKVNGQSATFVYVDGTEGWINVQETQTSETGTVAAYVAASATGCTGPGAGCIVDTDYKVHTFNGPGTFTVSNAGNFLGSDTVDYLVVAGGAGAVGYRGGGGGAGGYRESVPNPAAWTASPIAAPGGALPVSATAYPVAVGGGGAGSPSQANGNDSVFHTITSAGGGKSPGSDGGSGGGAGSSTPGSQGSGNTPPTSPPQGQDGGLGGASSGGGGGGGGAGAVGGNGVTADAGGDGGDGVTSNINNTPTARGGGGGSGGADASGGPGAGGSGGTGGGGTGGTMLTCNATAGQANTGGGGGGGGENRCNGQQGGSGIVIIRYKFQ